MREYAPYAVRGEVAVVSELLEAQHIHALLLHVPGYLLAGITGNLTSKVVYVVGGYLQILACRGFVFRQVELEDRRQISPVAEECRQRNQCPALMGQCPAECRYQIDNQEYGHCQPQ